MGTTTEDLLNALRHIAYDDCDLCDRRLCPTASEAIAKELAGREPRPVLERAAAALREKAEREKMR